MKNQIFMGGRGVTKNQYVGGRNYLKSGGWTVCRINRGPDKKRDVSVFEREVDTTMQTVVHYSFYNSLLLL